jgi:hypothetical protein
MFDPITILAALAPLGIEAGKAAIHKWMAPEQLKPATVEDYQKMKAVDLEFFKTLTQADSGGDTYPWVEAVRKLQRPFVTLAVLSTWAYCKTAGVAIEGVDNMAAAVGFYLFGDRSMFYIKKGASK